MVDIAANGCWVWRGAMHASGYGRFRFNGRTLGAHGFICAETGGPVPRGVDLVRTCADTRCVNPRHWERVTHVPAGCVFDEQDRALIEAHKWCRAGSGYAFTRFDGSPKAVWMHRLILDAPENCFVDHVNGNRLDNRRANLRLCTLSQNQWNRGKPSVNTSGYKGVVKQASASNIRWAARISANGKAYRLGSYATQAEARQAYADAATRLHGEFARTE